ncbi:MAG: DUF6034 family protein [Hominisplanchenecus sp.]
MKTGKRWMAAVCLFGITAGMLSACAFETPDDECIVREKETGNGTRIASAGDGLTIESQIQAPETCEMEVADGLAEVWVHAKVTTPNGEGMKIRSAKLRPFGQEDLDGWIRVLTQGKELWDYADSDYDQNMAADDTQAWMEESESGMVSYESEKYPVEWKMKSESGSDIQDGGETSEQEEEAVGESAEDSMSAEHDTPLEAEGTVMQEEFLSGYVDMQDIFASWASDEEKTYTCQVINTMQEGYPISVFDFTRTYRGTYVEWAEDEVLEKAETRITKKRMKKAADDLVETLGLSGELKYRKSEPVYRSEIDDSSYGGHLPEDSMGWRFYYVKEMDGIKMVHASNLTPPRDMMENLIFALESHFGWDVYDSIAELDGRYGGAMTQWNEEMFCVTFDDEGLVSVSWINPCALGENSSDNVFLLPFSEILQIFEKSITKQYVLEMLADMGIPVKTEITEIRLGYMMVRDDEKPGSGQMVPVWDFIGTYESESVEEMLGEEGNIWVQSYLKQKKSESLLTINATDGTILNWGYGG